MLLHGANTDNPWLHMKLFKPAVPLTIYNKVCDEKDCNENWLQFMLPEFWVVLAPSQCAHSSPHTRRAMPHLMGLHDFIGHPNETALPAHSSPHLLLHKKSSIKFSYLKKPTQKGYNVSVTTCFIPTYYFQTPQIPMLSSERFT